MKTPVKLDVAPEAAVAKASKETREVAKDNENLRESCPKCGGAKFEGCVKKAGDTVSCHDCGTLYNKEK